MKTLTKNLALLITLLAGFASAAPIVYSPKPYETPVLDETEEAVRWVFVNNTIVEFPSTITPDKTQQFQEEVYALIDTKVKRGYPGTMQALPRDSGTSFFSVGYLFRLAGKLNVWGANLVADNMDTVPAARVSVNKHGFALRLDSTFLNLQSPRRSWAVAFPYHFMVGNAQRYQDKFGYVTELISVSTGHARQKAKPGYSQATLMVVVSERSDLEAFKTDWLKVFGVMRAAGDCHWIFPGYECVSMEGINRSAVVGNLYFGTHGSRVIMVSYMGLPETFRHNLPHARDFINTLVWND